MAIDPTTPVLIGAAAVDQRVEEPGGGVDAATLMIRAARAAAADALGGDPPSVPASARAHVAERGGRSSTGDGLLGSVGWVAALEGTCRYPHPGRLVADAIGAPSAAAHLGPVGVAQEEIIARACRAVADGQADVALVVGGETKYRATLAARAGIEATVTEQPGVPPEPGLPFSAVGVTDLELERGLVEPVAAYAAIDTALAARRGWSADEHRRRLGALWEGFARVAASNPAAWDRTAPSAAEILTPGPENRMVAWPYTRRLASNWNVDQAGALLICSVAEARRRGITEERWVFPLASAVSNHAVPVAQRRRLDRSPGAAAAARAAFDHAGCELGGVDHVDLYSCFPAAVQVFAEELGLPLVPDAAPTVTGGMTFAGGPLNNYVVQALVRLVQLLRAEPGSVGLSTSVSGYVTKQGLGLWSTRPPDSPYRALDVTDEVAAMDEPVPLGDGGSEPAAVLGHTVMFSRGEPSRVVAVLETAEGRRTIGWSNDADLAGAAVAGPFVDRRVRVGDDGELHG